MNLQQHVCALVQEYVYQGFKATFTKSRNKGRSNYQGSHYKTIIFGPLRSQQIFLKKKDEVLNSAEIEKKHN